MIQKQKIRIVVQLVVRKAGKRWRERECGWLRTNGSCVCPVSEVWDRQRVVQKVEYMSKRERWKKNASEHSQKVVSVVRRHRTSVVMICGWFESDRWIQATLGDHKCVKTPSGGAQWCGSAPVFAMKARIKNTNWPSQKNNFQRCVEVMNATSSRSFRWKCIRLIDKANRLIAYSWTWLSDRIANVPESATNLSTTDDQAFYTVLYTFEMLK